MLDRRDFLKASACFGAAPYFGLPRIALAGAATDRRLIVVFQRGGQDGLHVLPPYRDPEYQRLRPHLAVPPPGEDRGALTINDTFGLHPTLSNIHRAWENGGLLVFPAIASRYRQRSHFDAQNLLENGSGVPFGATDGFLNRALRGMPARPGPQGFAVGSAIPLILQGKARIRSWAPSTMPDVDRDFLARLLESYQGDPLLHSALSESMRDGPTGEELTRRDTRRVNRGREPVIAARAVAESLRSKNGARIAVLEMNGWDTHSGQTPRMERLLAELDAVVATLQSELAEVWDQTLIVTMSEFGRTVAENGARGTDHGTAGTSFAIGGAVRSSEVVGDWPGLEAAARYEGRDLFPANSLEALLKTVCVDHLGIAPAFVEREVFPSTRSIRRFKGLLTS
ncbi:MAG: DUF1501 domain-containing protein [Myxococcota bacterium]